VGPAAAKLAFIFGPVEMTALLLLGLVLVTTITTGSRINAMTMVGVGLLLSSVGADFISGQDRFTFGQDELSDGLNVALVAMGTFGVAELLLLAESAHGKMTLLPQPKRLREMLPNRDDWKRSAMPIARGSLIGFVLGILPGAGALVASFASYAAEKKLSRHPEEFGHGAIEGVAGPESANNAAAQSSLIPLLGLGIPTNAIMGMMLGAMMIHGMAPGPKLIQESPQLFWGMITSLFIGNAMLVVLNIPLVWAFVALLRIPQHFMAPLIGIFCVVGAFSLSNSAFHVGLVCALGFCGYLFRKADYDLAPLVIAFVLGSIFEKTVRQSLLLGYGNPLVFLEHPISAILLALTALMIIAPHLKRFRLNAALTALEKQR